MKSKYVTRRTRETEAKVAGQFDCCTRGQWGTAESAPQCHINAAKEAPWDVCGESRRLITLAQGRIQLPALHTGAHAPLAPTRECHDHSPDL